MLWILQKTVILLVGTGQTTQQFTATLQATDFTVLTAHSAVQGLALHDKYLKEIALLVIENDMDAPDDGFRLLSTLRNRGDVLPAILLAANDTNTPHIDKLLGRNQLLVAPVSDDMLRKAVEESLSE